MKRYIEIIFDDSGSMAGRHASGVAKYEVAKEILCNTILPMLHPTDDVAVRLLRGAGCSPSVRNVDRVPVFAGQSSSLRDAIDAIDQFNKSTPLYLTIRDALDECSKLRGIGKHTDFKVFVLTDGGDTCSHDLYDLISPTEIQKWKVEFPHLDPVLVQFEIGSSITRSNLSQAIQALGGKSVQANDASRKTISSVVKSLRASGFDPTGMLPPCIESDPHASPKTWGELANSSLFFHQAQLLYDSSLLSFKPQLGKHLTHDEWVEFKFLHALAFVSQLPLSLVRTMIAQLERPLLYTHDCIRWDFATARWVYIDYPEEHEFIADPDARHADGLKSERPMFLEELGFNNRNENQFFAPDTPYIVTRKHAGFELVPAEFIDRGNGRQAVLRPGRQVVFKDV
jgi:hypothetical protein